MSCLLYAVDGWMSYDINTREPLTLGAVRVLIVTQLLRPPLRNRHDGTVGGYPQEV